jgi:adenosylhomocysteine nucleosidase
VNDTINNQGIMGIGNSTIKADQMAAGSHARIHNNPYASPQSSNSTAAEPRGIVVITIKPVEMSAVIDVFGLTREKSTPGGPSLYRGTVVSADGPVELFSARTLEQGQRSMMATLTHLRQRLNPATFVVLGIGGAIKRELTIDDVVVTTRVIYYDLRRETANGVRHRGEARDAPAVITHALNDFFTDYHEPAHLESGTGRFRVLHGPIGSGDALVMDEESWIRKFLLEYNEYTLAVDMEAAGLTQFCHETPPPQPGWLVIRGISDLADHTKILDHQLSAARNAAITLRHLIPYLPATKIN